MTHPSSFRIFFGGSIDELKSGAVRPCGWMSETSFPAMIVWGENVHLLPLFVSRGFIMSLQQASKLSHDVTQQASKLSLVALT